MLDPDDYGKGTHTVVVTATSLLGETSEYKVTFGKAFANGLDVAFTVEMIAIPNLQGFATFISPSQGSEMFLLYKTLCDCTYPCFCSTLSLLLSL